MRVLQQTVVGGAVRALHVSYATLLGSSAGAYARTRAWARALYDTTAKDAAGMRYRPRHARSHNVVVLWGDRLSRSDFEIVEGPASLARADLYTRILAVAADRGFVVAAVQ